jgi:amidase
VAAALESLAKGLEKQGAKVARRSDLLPDLDAGARIFMALLSAAMAARVPNEVYVGMAEAAARVSADDRSFGAEMARGAALTHRDWAGFDAPRKAYRAQWRALFGEFDAVISPVTPTPAFPHDHEPQQSKRHLIVNGKPQDYFGNVLWPGVATMPGLPATALPIGRSPEGLPIGAQIVGPWLEDRTPLMLAKLIEREFGGFVAPSL